METRFKSEQSRLRKKYAADMRDLEVRIEEITRINIDLGKQNKGLGARVKVICEHYIITYIVDTNAINIVQYLNFKVKINREIISYIN